MKKLILAVLGITFMFSCNTNPESITYTNEQVEAESAKANTFFDNVFNETMDRHPMFQAYLGIKKDNDKWEDLSEEFADLEHQITKDNLKWMKDSIIFDALNNQTRISYDLFIQDAENEISDHQYRYHNYPVNQMFGAHSQAPAMLINMHPIDTVSDARAYINRLEILPDFFTQLIKSLEIREEKGIIPPKFVFPRVIDDCKNIITGAPFDNLDRESTLLADFTVKVNKLDIGDDEKKSLIDEANNALISGVKPAYESLIAFLKGQQERANEDDGVWKFENGSSYYDNALKRTTTTNLTAEEIHQIGLSEVDRIHSEMREIMGQVEFEGDLQAFFEFLRTDDQFYYPNTEEGKQDYMDSAKTIIDNMEARLDELFLTKPKAKMVVKRVEEFREKSAGKAFYNAPALDGSRPGTYYANLYNSRNMPKYEMEALAYHEGIPGHHMDRTISQELTGIPMFRKIGGYTAHIEGWGLYCEYLPKEIGMYANPYSDYGRLAMELWRACRLVVDTGIHLKKWTRQEGIDYYQANTSGSERDCERMVERHIVMASQATAYKIGMLKILELRKKASDALGDSYDIREFHDVILTNGALPLNVLETLVDDYIASKQM